MVGIFVTPAKGLEILFPIRPTSLIEASGRGLESFRQHNAMFEGFLKICPIREGDADILFSISMFGLGRSVEAA